MRVSSERGRAPGQEVQERIQCRVCKALRARHLLHRVGECARAMPHAPCACKVHRVPCAGCVGVLRVLRAVGAGAPAPVPGTGWL